MISDKETPKKEKDEKEPPKYQYGLTREELNPILKSFIPIIDKVRSRAKS